MNKPYNYYKYIVKYSFNTIIIKLCIKKATH